MRADRLLSLMLLLRARGRLTARDLAEQLEVTERTIYRDIDALNTAGVPVYTQPGTNGGIFLDEHYRISLTGLTRSEVMSLFVSSETGPLQDLGLARAVEDALLKLFTVLPSPQRQEVDQMRQRLFIDPHDWYSAERPAPLLPRLQQAVWEDRVIDACYEQAVGETVNLTLEPYGLVAKANRWHLVGQEAGGEMQVWRACNFQDVQLSEQRFPRDPAVDLETFWKGWSEAYETEMGRAYPPYPARIRVHPATLWLFYDGFMSCQYTQAGPPDDQGWVTLDVVFPAMENAIMHILGLSRYVEVLTPDDLRDWVLLVAQDIVKHYTPTPPETLD